MMKTFLINASTDLLFFRSIEMLGPVLDALTNTKEKYEN